MLRTVARSVYQDIRLLHPASTATLPKPWSVSRYSLSSALARPTATAASVNAVTQQIPRSPPAYHLVLQEPSKTKRKATRRGEERAKTRNPICVRPSNKMNSNDKAQHSFENKTWRQTHLSQNQSRNKAKRTEGDNKIPERSPRPLHHLAYTYTMHRIYKLLSMAPKRMERMEDESMRLEEVSKDELLSQENRLLPLKPSRSRSRSHANLSTDLMGFIDKIPGVLHRRKLRSILPGAENDPVARLFRSDHLPPFSAWKQYARFDPSKPYTRNLVSTDHQTYALLVLCWNPGQRSPIHDHPCDGCWLSVLKGELTEVLYQRSDVSSPVGQHSLGVGESSCISNATDLVHSVGNPSSSLPAVSLHLYAPPIVGCRCWDGPENGGTFGSDEGPPSDRGTSLIG